MIQRISAATDRPPQTGELIRNNVTATITDRDHETITSSFWQAQLLDIESRLDGIQLTASAAPAT